MKILLFYWLIGCAVAGPALGEYAHRCPNDDIPPVDVVAIIAAWPTLFTALPVYIHFDIPAKGCKK